MTCEFFPDPCEDCYIPYCHADIKQAEEDMLMKLDEVNRLGERLNEALAESHAASERYTMMRRENRRVYPGAP